jgi:hypothetical protein
MAQTPTGHRVAAGLTPLLLLAIAITTLIDHPTAPAAWVIGFVALLLGLVAVFDLPLESRATHAGIARRCLGRSALLRWDRVVAIEVTRSAVSAVDLAGRRSLLAAGHCEWVQTGVVPDSVTIRTPH